VEDKEFIPSSLQRLVSGTTTLTAGMWGRKEGRREGGREGGMGA